MSLLLLLTALAFEPKLPSTPPPAYGTLLDTEINVGGVTVELKARFVPCVRNKQCVQLPNGRRAFGTVQGNRFVVEES